MVGGFDLELKIWLNQIVGDFELLCRTDWSRTVRLLIADGPPLVSVNRGRSAFSSADVPPLADFSEIGQIDMYQHGLILLL